MQIAYDLAAARKNERQIKVRRVRLGKTLEPANRARLASVDYLQRSE
jgi:hypothetical protein